MLKKKETACRETSEATVRPSQNVAIKYTDASNARDKGNHDGFFEPSPQSDRWARPLLMLQLILL